MGKPSIIDKLEDHLAFHMPPTEECHVMYLMAEIRKILEHDNSSDKYPALRFYCNWCVHTHLDRPNRFMKQAAENIELEIQGLMDAKLPISKGKSLSAFLSMQELRRALAQFLGDNCLPTTLTDGDNWKSFHTLLSDIISEQPILAPSKKIAEFVYDDFGNVIIQYEVTPPLISPLKFVV
jgi:hypothetical protein